MINWRTDIENALDEKGLFWVFMRDGGVYLASNFGGGFLNVSGNTHRYDQITHWAEINKPEESDA